jgi:hypothetical protein
VPADSAPPKGVTIENHLFDRAAILCEEDLVIRGSASPEP